MIRVILFTLFCFFVGACGGGEVVRVATVHDDLSSLHDTERAEIARIKEAQKGKGISSEINHVIKKAPHISAREYLERQGGLESSDALDYTAGGYDVLGIIVYEEPDLSRDAVRVSADGYITFPLIGRVKVADKTTAEIENMIAVRLAEGQFLVNPHVSVLVKEYLSKKVLILGAVERPGSYELRASERVLEVISRAGGVDFAEGGNKITILRTESVGGAKGEKIGIDIHLRRLLDGEDPLSNLQVFDKDVIYIPKADKVFMIGEVKNPGDYVIKDRDITLVEAIGMAGGFTRIAARNRTKIIRIEDGVEKIIHVRVDEITGEGKKAQDILLKPNDIIVVPESFF
ncbi:MAG: polysaccharide biosynthesis/export family protein [Desulfobacterales bacterium]|nr:polysaccharide biosynthesis/export family protein [Desulfobacterales bacterium]